METKVAKKSVEPKNDESKVYIDQEKIEDPNITEQENTPTNSKGRTIKNIPNHITELALIVKNNAQIRRYTAIAIIKVVVFLAIIVILKSFLSQL